MQGHFACQRSCVGRCASVRAGMRLGMVLLASVVLPQVAGAQEAFAAATIRPSAAAVKFEHDGKTETTPGMLRMQDVTVNTCIKWAYGVQDSQIAGPEWMQSEHFDITAKADHPAGEVQMKVMMQGLLAERFKLAFHRQQKELKSFALMVAKGGAKLKPAEGDGKSVMHNSANATVATSTTMKEFGDMLSGPLQTPVVDMTGLKGKYDFTLDFTNYLPDDMKTMRPDATSVLMSALPGELGLKLEGRKEMVEVMVVDHVEKPSEN
jgi:uncharacterized protein (TIGR03435 family)